VVVNYQQYSNYIVAVSFIGGGLHKKTNDLPKVTDTSPQVGISVAINTDCIGGYNPTTIQS
jgi:hypothetical protein